jgi:post-segregation antitoxin (ccd killing protein)
MAISYGNEPPEDPPQRSTARKQDVVSSPARSRSTSSDRPVYEKEARAPRGRKAVYVDTLTHARATQAAAELGLNLNDMAEEAMRNHLKQAAADLFQREFRAEQEHASATRKPTPQAWEFQETWRAPAWTRE